MSASVNTSSLWTSLKANRTGLLIGALFGFWTGGLFGLLFGGALGYWIQRRLSGRSLNPQQAFFEATFSVMGKVAKADGRVSETEIQYAREVMARMNLTEAKQREAIGLFNRGKGSDFDIAETVVPLARLLRFRPELKQMFLEVQLQAAFADGQVSSKELLVIQQLCELISVSFSDLEQVLQRARAGHAFHEHTYSFHRQAQGPSEAALLKDAYGVLGVDEKESDAVIKRAYRKLMSQHHPDKLVSKGLPEEMIQLAKEKTQEIQSAYDRVKTARKA